MKLKYELYIAATLESAEIYKRTLPKADFFNCDALTLDGFIKKLASSSAHVEKFIAKMVFREAIKKSITKLKHFQFSKENMFENSMETLYDFYDKLQTNDVGIDEFVSGSKKEDVLLIFKEYEKIKLKKHILDDSDMLKAIKDQDIMNFLEKYDSIIIDWQFNEADISFIKSDIHQKILSTILQHDSLQKEKQVLPSQDVEITLNKSFDFGDEAREAVRIAKDLLSRNIPLNKIAIVTPSIDEYKSSLEVVLKEYGIKGYISKGKSFINTALYHEVKNYSTEEEFKSFATLAEKRLKKLDKEFAYEYKQVVDFALNIAQKSFTLMRKLDKDALNIKVKFSEVFEHLCQNASYQPFSKANSILVTEHNQVLRSEFSHVIYLGVDSTHLPQSFSNNFLYNSLNAQKLHVSNYYKDAVYIYETLKKNSANLHIITAQYQDKRELQVSSIITDNYTHKLEPYMINDNIKSLNDMLDIKMQTPLEKTTQEFINSMQVVKEDMYHGVVGDEYIYDKTKGITFSASRLNEFSSCPLKYYFNYILKAKSPTDFNDDEFSSADAGTLFHSMAEEFAKLYRANGEILIQKEDIDTVVQKVYEDEYIKALPTVKGKPHETVFHKQKKQELQIAVDRFKEYVKAGELDDFYKAEESFYFSMDGNNFTGIIDRIDIQKERVTLIDYKTSKAEYHTGSKDSKYEKLTKYEEFQLPLYHFFVDQGATYNTKVDSNSYLITFAGNMTTTNKRFGQTDSSKGDEKTKVFHLSPEAKVKYKDEIVKIASKINNGEFYFKSSEDSCQYCSYKSICGDGIIVEKKF